MSLDKAFRELRGRGYFAERNFLCCSSCAWAEVPEDKADKVVFIHEQNEDRLREGQSAYIGWAGDGKEIVGVLESNGVRVNWDGSEDTAIEVTV